MSAIPQPDPESERSRKRFSYIDDEANNHLRQLHEIRPQHFVFSTEEEAARLQKFVGDTRLRKGNEMTRKLKALILILVANCIKLMMMVFIQISKYSEKFCHQT